MSEIQPRKPVSNKFVYFPPEDPPTNPIVPSHPPPPPSTSAPHPADSRFVVAKSRPTKLAITFNRANSDPPAESCPICQTPLPLIPLLRHILTAHNLPGVQDSPTNCTFCEATFPNVESVIQHATDRHSIDFYKRLSDVALSNGLWPKIESFIRSHEPPPPPKLGLDPSKIAKKGTSITEIPPLVRAHLDELHQFELFLRMFDLIETDRPRGQCRICSHSCDSLLQLTEHCFRLHSVKITPELRRILMIMTPDVTPETPDAALLTMRKLRLDLLVRGGVRSWPTGDPSVKKNVPRLFADFLMEGLATEPKEPHRTPKDFDRPVQVWLEVPVALPVLFSASDKPGSRLLSLADTNVVSAKEIWEQVNCVLNKLHKEKIMVVSVSDVSRHCQAFSVENIHELVVQEKVDVLKGPEIFEEKTVSFVLYVRGDVNGNARTVIQSWFVKGRMCRCKNCDALYDPAIPEPCEGKMLGILRISKKNGVHELGTVGSISKIEFVEKTVGEVARTA